MLSHSVVDERLSWSHAPGLRLERGDLFGRDLENRVL